jgi:hypothetical protein
MGWEPRYTEEQVRDAVSGAISYADALRRLGLRSAGHNHRSIKRLVEHYGISVDHFDPNWANRVRNRERSVRPLAQVLVEHSTFNRGHLKRRLYAEGLKERRCEMCGQGEEWHGRQMSLILDHINGVTTTGSRTSRSSVRTVRRLSTPIAGATGVCRGSPSTAFAAESRSSRSIRVTATARSIAAPGVAVRARPARSVARSSGPCSSSSCRTSRP